MTGTRSRRLRMPSSGVRRRSGLVLSSVRPLADRISAELGLVVWDLEFRHQAGGETLLVAVDRPGPPIDAGLIARFAEALARELDALDAVPGDARYTLEVTSPGAERKLRTPEQFQLCRDRPARLTFKDGREPVEGVIAEASAEGVSIEGAGRFALDEISQARLTVRT